MSYLDKYYWSLINRHEPFLLLEDGRDNVLLQENEGRIKLDTLEGDNVKLPLDEGNGNPNFIGGTQTGEFNLNANKWLYDSIETKNVIDFGDERNSEKFLGNDLASQSFSLPTIYELTVKCYVYSDCVGASTDRYRTIFRGNNRPLLVLGSGRSIYVDYDGSQSEINLPSVWGQSFGTALFSLNTWFEIKLTVNRTLGTIDCEVDNVSVGSTVTPINGAINSFAEVDQIGRERESTFPENFRGRLSNIVVTDLT